MKGLRRWLPASSLLASAAASVWIWGAALAPEAQLRVTFLDVGQGDSIVIQTPSGHTMLVDTGRMTGDDDEGRRVVLPFLRAQGINRLDALLLTHPDDDHIGGARSVLMRMTVDRLLISGLPSDSANYRLALEAAREHHVSIVELARGQTIDFHDSVVADVLNPPAGRRPRSHHPDNDGSLVIRVRRESTSILLTGDAEAVAEENMVRKGLDVHADILKLGHHGSKTSSCERFLGAVQPLVAIVSAGKRNVFGHPHPDVLARLTARHIQVFRTDRDGAITVVSDGRRLTINRERQGRLPVHE